MPCGICGKGRDATKKAIRVILILAAALLFILWQNCSLQTETFRVVDPALPQELDGLRVLELADLHGRQFGAENRRLLRAAAAAKPDIICLDGDIFDEKTDLSMLAPLMRGLTAIAPTYYVTGNHEWQVDGLRDILTELERLGVTVLENEFTVFSRGGAQIVIAGVNDPCGPYDQKTPSELMDEIRAEYPDAFVLMLAHRNDTLPMWAELAPELVLTGHCHGGVVRLPAVGGVFGTRRDLFPDYDAGLYRQDGTQLFVSRGLGYSRVRFRLFNRPQLPILVLKSSET